MALRMTRHSPVSADAASFLAGYACDVGRSADTVMTTKSSSGKKHGRPAATPAADTLPQPASSRKGSKKSAAQSQLALPPEPSSSSSSGGPKRSKNTAKSRPALPFPQPAGWRATYDLITELRADRTAVVDTMGCEAIAEDAENDEVQAYQTLISLMLSSQTKDTVNHATMVKLREDARSRCSCGLSVQSMLETPDDTLHELIKSVGFHNNKVRYIKQATQMLVDEHGGKVPDTMEELLKLPGVGPKMALITLHVAFGKVEGISVDTHVHRICNQVRTLVSIPQPLGRIALPASQRALRACLLLTQRSPDWHHASQLNWAGEGGAKQPEGTRKAIEAWMPRDIWPEVNLLLVGLGQEVQTERAKLLKKCLACSDPLRALRLAETLGVPVEKALKAADLEPPEGFVAGA